MRPHKACRAAGLAHGIVRMTQSRRQVVRSKFLHQCADTAPGKPPFIAAAARVFVKVRQPFHVRPFWHGQDECAKQGTVDDIHLKAVRCQLPPSRYPRTHGAVSSPRYCFKASLRFACGMRNTKSRTGTPYGWLCRHKAYHYPIIPYFDCIFNLNILRRFLLPNSVWLSQFCLCGSGCGSNEKTAAN